MSMAFFGWINPYSNRSAQTGFSSAGFDAETDSTEQEYGVGAVSGIGSLLADAMSFQRHRNQRVLRPLAVLTLFTTAWLLFPRTVFAKPRVYKAYSQLTEKGLTQTPGAELRKKIEAREEAEREKQTKPRADVESLTDAEMRVIRGRGQYRNKYYAGSPMPWHRSLRDVNLCTGNLFKSFTDVQVAPGRGAGLVLQRTYNSSDDRAGAFGTGWTHAYDIRIEEAGAVVENNVEKELVPRTDFFGGKHRYTRDADGLYTPPGYLYDETDSRYDDEMVSGLPRSLEDIQVGMDGTTKHFVPEGLDAQGNPSTVRVCDYIEDRHGNRTTLTYGQTVAFPDGSTKKLLTQVKDPVNRTLTFTWLNMGTSAAPAYRITSVQSPLYTVAYEYYLNPADTSSYLNLWKARVDSTGLNRTTTYTYTSTAGETGLLASIADPLGHTVTYAYNAVAYVENNVTVNKPLDTVWVSAITEPAGVDPTGNPRTQTWNVISAYGRNAGPSSVGPILLSTVAYSNGGGYYSVIVDPQLRANTIWTSYYNEVQFEYDINNNVIQTYHNGSTGKSVTFPGKVPTYRESATYGPHGNVLTQSTRNAGNQTQYSQTSYTYYNASKYFQKASVTDGLGRTSTFDYFDRSDAVVGNRGNVKWDTLSRRARVTTSSFPTRTTNTGRRRRRRT